MNELRTWTEINLDNLIFNYNNVKAKTKCKRVMAVIKADAYGHGSVEVAKTLEEQGCDYFAVANLDEGVQLRENGIKSNILVLGYVDIDGHEEALDNDLMITISDINSAENMDEIASIKGKKANIHVKIDTGMTRFGFDCNTATNDVREVSKLKNLNIEGIYTHFSTADEYDKAYTLMQFESFINVVKELEKTGVHIPLKHASNSAATLMYPEMHLDIVRCGIALFGCYPSEEVSKDVALKPCMVLKTKIIRIREVEKDIAVSYGRKYVTQGKTVIGTLPIGYADGYTTLLFEKANVVVNGKRAKVIGKICMDSCMIDITNIDNVNNEDVVEVFGNQISVEEVASQIGTVNYEVLCMVSKRVPRVYFKNNEITNTLKYIVEK